MEEEQIRNLIARYLANQIDRSVFSQQFAGLYFRVRNSRNASLSARRLCDVAVLPLAELSRGHRTEQSFREELANAVRPFASLRYLNAGDMIEIELPSGKKPFEVERQLKPLAKAAAMSPGVLRVQVA